MSWLQHIDSESTKAEVEVRATDWSDIGPRTCSKIISPHCAIGAVIRTNSIAVGQLERLFPRLQFAFMREERPWLSCKRRPGRPRVRRPIDRGSDVVSNTNEDPRRRPIDG
jgi:hypothetical protein